MSQGVTLASPGVTWRHMASPGFTWHHLALRGVTLASHGVTLALRNTSMYVNPGSCWSVFCHQKCNQPCLLGWVCINIVCIPVCRLSITHYRPRDYLVRTTRSLRGLFVNVDLATTPHYLATITRELRKAYRSVSTTFIALNIATNFNRAAANDLRSGFGPVGRMLEVTFWSVS